MTGCVCVCGEEERSFALLPFTIVMPGLNPGIHAAGAAASGEGSGMDPGVKPRGDGVEGGAESLARALDSGLRRNYVKRGLMRVAREAD